LGEETIRKSQTPGIKPVKNFRQRNVEQLENLALDAWSLLHKEPPEEGWCHLDIRFSVSAKHLELDAVEVRYIEETPDGYREYVVSVPRKDWKIGLRSMFKTAMMEFRCRKNDLIYWGARSINHPKPK
jgi:hypothetical protein